jgi:hypothetical protein
MVRAPDVYSQLAGAPPRIGKRLAIAALALVKMPPFFQWPVTKLGCGALKDGISAKSKSHEHT